MICEIQFLSDGRRFYINEEFDSSIKISVSEGKEEDDQVVIDIENGSCFSILVEELVGIALI